ncbi:uncharacterized protein LOC110985070 [Acanthaster planci]|uniref:Uncharacterized protein LOC110985070 n=1 Tax=Acanthaster planci TaxID=133434 RepID=A0A8B7Z962_ACAPL|nr:uncharacterized protein LOC110985070 [Acanthaster planci]
MRLGAFSAILYGFPMAVLLVQCAVLTTAQILSGPSTPRGPSSRRGRPAIRGDLGPPGTRTATPIDVTTITINNTTVGLCKYKHFCRSLGCQSRNDTRPSLCHCDPECVIYDDCCYDYTETCGRESQEADSLWQNETQKEMENLSCVSPNKNAESYYLVSTCPSDTTDIQTAVLCRNPDPHDSLSVIPSYSQNSRRHFKNIYCALCHGEALMDLVAWEIVVECRTLLLNRRATSLLQTSISNVRRVERELGCDIMIQPPNRDEVTVRPRHCYSDVIRHCVAPQLREACEAYTAYTTVAGPGPNSNKVFQNPHCALCNVPNGPDRLDYATDCRQELTLPVFYPNVPVGTFPPRPRPGRPGEPDEGGDKGSPGIPGVGGPTEPDRPIEPPPPEEIPPISVLFDFRSDSRVKIVRNREVLVSEIVQCPPNEVYDPFISSCRRLSCPDGYLLKDNKCAPDFKTLGKACDGDSGGDGDIVMEVSVSLEEHCQDSLLNGGDSLLTGDLQLCLEEFLGLEQRSLQFGSSTPALANVTPVPTFNCTSTAQYSFSVNTTGETLMDFRGISKLSLPDSSLCQTIASRETWFIEFRQTCQSLPIDKCTGIWLNDTTFSIPAENGTTLIYINASESWFTLNQTIIRANFQRREDVFEQFTDIQICAEPKLTCPRVRLNSTLFEADENNPGSIIYTPIGKLFQMDEFIRTENGDIEVCSFYEINGTRNGTKTATFLVFSQAQTVLSLIANIISMTAALVTFTTYCVFKELRKRISLAIMSLVACLFLAQLLLLVSGSATSNPSACTTVAVLGHFLWLATVLWTGVLAFALNRVFVSISKIRRLDVDLRVYFSQGIFVFGGAFLVVLPCLVIHLCDCTDIPLSYGNENVCWIGNNNVNLVAFGVPIGLTVLVNSVLFILTIHGMRNSKKMTNVVTEKTELQKLKQELVVYIRISSLMGFTWIFGFVAAFTDVVALWYIFIILNSCQGLLIFLSFICNKRVWRLWTNLLCGGRQRPTGAGPTSTTPSSQQMTMKPKSTGTLMSSASQV